MYVKPKLTLIEAEALERLLQMVTSYRDEPDKLPLQRVGVKLAQEIRKAKAVR